MFPSEPIRRYITLSFAKKLDETAKAYGEEHAKIRLKMSPNSSMYFQAVVLAGVRLHQSRGVRLPGVHRCDEGVVWEVK